MRRLVISLGWAVCLGLGTPAHARTCEEVRADIADTMDAAGLRGYSLQIVPAGTPLAGARVVGSCAGGARKIAYRRFALPQAQPHVSEAPPPSPAPPAPVATPEPAPQSLPAPAPAVVPQASATTPLALVAQAEATPPPRVTAPAIVSQAAAPQTTPASGADAPPPPPATASLVAGLLVGAWPWLGGLVLLLTLLATFWRWWRGGMDAAGLPRGPRL